MSDQLFLAADDLAGLPGMPKTTNGTRRWLRAHHITSRDVAGRGGPNGKRTEYAVVELPRETRAALALNAARGERIDGTDIDAAQLGGVEGAKLVLRDGLAERAIRAVQEDSLKASVAIRGKAEQRMEAKLAILRERESFQKAGELSVKASEHYFAAAYNKREIPMAEWVRALVPDVAPATLTLWRRIVRTKGITALAGNYGNRKGDGKIDRQPQLRDFIIGLLVKAPHARATHVMQAIEARFGAANPVKKPSLSALERWLTAWRGANAQTLTALANPDAWKAKHMVAFGSMSDGIERVNQRWELDSTPADVMLVDGRYNVLGLIDVCSRRAKLLVSKTSKATAVAQLIRGAILEFGVPEEAKTDNGADYVSKHIARVFAQLDIKQTLCPPFQPWHKPHVERFFNTFSHDLVELLDGFIGHNVAERKAIEDRKSFADRLMKRGAEPIALSMSAPEFQKFCDDWIDGVYSHRPHEGLDGRSPFEVAAASRAPVRRIQDERALDVLLGEGVYRSVQKKGIEIEGAWFIAPELEAHVGDRVLCLQLPDLGRVVVQGGPDLTFLCVAECPERTGIDRRDVAIRAKEMQKARVQEERRRLRGIAREARTEDVVNEILADRAQKAARLAPFPRPTIVHASSGLSSAADAVAELHRPARSTTELMSDDQARAERARIDGVTAGIDNELARRRDEVAPVFENTYERVVWLLQRAKVRALTAEEQEALAYYKRQQPASYRQLKEMVDEQSAATGQGAPEVGAA